MKRFQIRYFLNDPLKKSHLATYRFTALYITHSSPNLISSYYQKELDLSRNQLRGFDDELVDKLLSIESVKFDHNPFVCDLCNMVAILERQQEVRYFKLAAAFNN